VRVPAHGTKTLWVGVAGSDKGAAAARSELDAALANPARALARKIDSRERLADYSKLSLPGDRRLEQGIDWGKQNIADLTQRADDLKIRFVNEGKPETQYCSTPAAAAVRRAPASARSSV
jgi:hypothetical protein